MDEPRGHPDAILRPSRGRAGDHRRAGAGVGGAGADSSTTTGTSAGGPPSRTGSRSCPQPRIHLAAEDGRLLVHGISREPFFRHADRHRPHDRRAFHPGGFRPFLGAASARSPAPSCRPATCSASTTGRSRRTSSATSTSRRWWPRSRSYLLALDPPPDPVVAEVRALVAPAEQRPRRSPGPSSSPTGPSTSLRSLQRLFTDYVGDRARSGSSRASGSSTPRPPRTAARPSTGPRSPPSSASPTRPTSPARSPPSSAPRRRPTPQPDADPSPRQSAACHAEVTGHSGRPVSASPTPEPDHRHARRRAPIASPRRGEALNQVRSRRASTAHTLSRAEPDHEREQPEQQHLRLHVARAAVDELRQHGREDHERLGVRHADHEALPHAPGAGSSGAARRRVVDVDAVPVPDRLDAELDDVRRTGELEHREHRDRLLRRPRRGRARPGP